MKLYRETKVQKQDFYIQVQSLARDIENDITFPSRFLFQQSFGISRSFIDLQQDIGMTQRTSISFIVLDQERNIIFEHILEKPKFTTLHFDTQNEVYTEKGTFIFIQNLHNLLTGKQIIFFKNISY